VVTGPERNDLWERMIKIWPAYAAYQAGIEREIPIIVLEPTKSHGKINVMGGNPVTNHPRPIVKWSSGTRMDQGNLMFISLHKKTFWRDFLVIQVGFALFGLAIALMIRSNLGTGAWAVLEVALANITHLTPGTLSILVGSVVLLAALLLKEKIGWGTIANILFIGPWEDFFLWLLPNVKGIFILQLGMILISIVIMGIASAIYIGVHAGAGPRDSLMLAVKRKMGTSIRVARAGIEISMVLVGWLLGGPLGIGTVIIAILIGPAVQWGFKIFHVHPHPNPEITLGEAEIQAE